MKSGFDLRIVNDFNSFPQFYPYERNRTSISIGRPLVIELCKLEHLGIFNMRCKDPEKGRSVLRKKEDRTRGFYGPTRLLYGLFT